MWVTGKGGDAVDGTMKTADRGVAEALSLTGQRPQARVDVRVRQTEPHA